MCKDLRKVFFRRNPLDGRMPNLSPTEQRAKEDDEKVREGYFHAWTQVVDTSGDIPVAKSVALVEDAEDGKIYPVEYYCLAFKEGVL